METIEPISDEALRGLIYWTATRTGDQVGFTKREILSLIERLRVAEEKLSWLHRQMGKEVRS